MGRGPGPETTPGFRTSLNKWFSVFMNTPATNST
jgi:hypothetical protein